MSFHFGCQQNLKQLRKDTVRLSPCDQRITWPIAIVESEQLDIVIDAKQMIKAIMCRRDSPAQGGEVFSQDSNPQRTAEAMVDIIRHIAIEGGYLFFCVSKFE